MMFMDSHLGTGSVDGPSILMEGVRRQHEHHNKQNNDKEESKGWFAIFYFCNFYSHTLLPVKEPVFVRTLKLKFNLLNPLEKNHHGG